MDGCYNENEKGSQIVLIILRGSPCGVIAKLLDHGLKISEFEIQLRYHVLFLINTLGKSLNPLSLQLWVK